MSTVAVKSAVHEVMDPKGFRNALGRFASGVAIVTAKVGDELAGMTISSFNSVSLDPPLVLFSIDCRANSLPIFENAEGYAVNILEQAEEDLCMKFAKALTDKWEGLEYESGYAGAPLLGGSIVQFECKPYAQYDGGDHTIFVAEVVRYTESEGKPLVFFKGKFQELKSGHEVEHQEMWPMAIHY